MNQRPTSRGRRGPVLWLLLAPFALCTPAQAERETDASEPVVISDDITNRATEVSSATAGAPGVPKTNRSGLGDGTNPGKGAGKTNSPNEGTDNPNNKPSGKGKP